jgi:hypothetical protein
LIRLPYQVRIPASISGLRRRARAFADVGDTCFHGQRLGDAIAGEEKAAPITAATRAPPHQTASGEVASTAPPMAGPSARPPVPIRLYSEM